MPIDWSDTTIIAAIAGPVATAIVGLPSAFIAIWQARRAKIEAEIAIAAQREMEKERKSYDRIARFANRFEDEDYALIRRLADLIAEYWSNEGVWVGEDRLQAMKGDSHSKLPLAYREIAREVAKRPLDEPADRLTSLRNECAVHLSDQQAKKVALTAIDHILTRIETIKHLLNELNAGTKRAKDGWTGADLGAILFDQSRSKLTPETEDPVQAFLDIYQDHRRETVALLTTTGKPDTTAIQTRN